MPVLFGADDPKIIGIILSELELGRAFGRQAPGLVEQGCQECRHFSEQARIILSCVLDGVKLLDLIMYC